MQGRIVGVVIFAILITFLPNAPQAYLSKFTEGGLIGKIVLSEVGTTKFEVEVDGRTFLVTISGGEISSLVFSPDARTIVMENGKARGMIEAEIPKELLGGEFTVMVDDKQIEFDMSETESHSTLLFEDPAGSSAITIQGTTAVPEFPIAIIVLAGIVAVALMITRAKIRYNTKNDGLL